jgi:hypothetical protein
MTSATQIATTVLILMLLSGPTAVAYHWDDEQDNTSFMSHAGDENVQRDGGECFNATRELEGTHCVVLYGHVFGLLNAVPINVQSPADCAPDLARGFSGEVHLGEKNKIDLYSSPGFVEYSTERCGGSKDEEPRLHPERGLSSDIRVSEEVPIYGYWYLSADSAEFSPLGIGSGEDAEPSMGVMPCVSVRMQMWTQRHIGQGTLLAEGTTTKTVVSTPQAAGDTSASNGLIVDPCPGADGTIDPQQVTEFQVALEPVTELTIPEHEGYVIGVKWYQHDGGDPADDPNIMQREWNLRTGSQYPNRIVMAVEDSIRIDDMRLVEFGGSLWIVADINTPWGSYDVDTANIRLEFEDADGQPVPIDHLAEPRLDYSVDHDGHYDPVNVRYEWDHRNEDLPPGTYTVRLVATNWQHTEDAIAERTFTLHEQGTLQVDGSIDETDINESAFPPLVIAMIAMLVPLLRATGRRRNG